MGSLPRLVVRDIRVHPVLVPLRLPLQTSNGTIRTAPLALIDLRTDEGVTGSTYLFCYTPLALGPVVAALSELGAVIRGDGVEPLEIGRKLHAHFRLLGASGVMGMAIAGIDMAAWDALARAQGLPLARLLGGSTRRTPAYNSCGLGMIGPGRAPDEAARLAAAGFSAIKVRLGYPDARTDLEVVRAVKSAIGDEVRLMADFNQALSVAEAVSRIEALSEEGLTWVEEPTLADDFAGHAYIRGKSSIPIQMGENWWGPREMARCLAAGGSDLGMPDAMKIGGVSGWIQAAALATTAGLPISSHLFPEVSAHLLAISPTAHWLEYVDWADAILRAPLRIEGGQAVLPDDPGSGIEWDEDAVRKFAAA